MLMPSAKPLGELENDHEFAARHIGLSEADEAHMLQALAVPSRRELMERIVPRSIARAHPMQLPAPLTEAAALSELKAIAQRNQ
jgi:glycine dehydrogenase